ncbi:MAG: 50S ribosomal protein L18 [Planctomycetota bacterium]|jgi:large subunit ribosomal protein L18
MNRNELKNQRRTRRKKGLRKHVIGGPNRPRMTVFRSNKHMYVQVIDDLGGRTVASASTLDKEQRPDNGGNRDAAAVVGKLVAERAMSAGVKEVVFDRAGYRYHGRVKSLADAAREAGLKF